jgi:hypothetical protein
VPALRVVTFAPVASTREIVKASFAPRVPVSDCPPADDDGSDELVGADVGGAAGGVEVVLLPPQAATRERRAAGMASLRSLISGL